MKPTPRAASVPSPSTSGVQRRPAHLRSRAPWLAAGGVALGLVGLMSAYGRAGDGVRANPTCTRATALLIVSDGADDDKPWRVIRDVLRSNKQWVLVASPEENVTDHVALVRWSIKHTYAGGPTTAYTVQCGHGGTCNDIAGKMAERFPQMAPPPASYCDVSNLLESPTPGPFEPPPPED